MFAELTSAICDSVTAVDEGKVDTEWQIAPVEGQHSTPTLSAGTAQLTSTHIAAQIDRGNNLRGMDKGNLSDPYVERHLTPNPNVWQLTNECITRNECL